MAMATGGASAASDYLATKPEVEASLKMVDLKYLVEPFKGLQKKGRR